ncbi:MAG: thermonuclease family protein, partial [Myxococcota bacterium]
MRRTLCLASVFFTVMVPRSEPVRAEAATMVFVNGQAGPAYFNDGDTLKVTGGPMAGTRARLAGFNTLESYGPVHRWGDWTHKELYFNAKQATLFSRRGVWHCEGDGARDGYGRLLLECDDLAIALIREGLAHALTITAEPSKPT